MFQQHPAPSRSPVELPSAYRDRIPGRLLSGSGVVSGTSFNQPCDEGAEEGSASATCVVHELEEAGVIRQLLLQDATVWARP